MESVSVLMSLYDKERPEYLRACLESILQQTMQPAEIVIVLDGPISSPLQQILSEFTEKTPLMRCLPQKENKGLGISLAIGVEACRYQLIARMDTDDIMQPTRLEEQVQAFAERPNLQICGSNIAEFVTAPSAVQGHRVVPESNAAIRQFARRRNPFNHMTVMFKRDAVLEAGNYQPLKSFEDYFLWARMLMNGAAGYNIQKDLVFARIGKDMYARRGGIKYLMPGLRGRYAVYQTGLSNLGDLIIVCSIHIIVSIMPNRLRGWLYTKKLHA